MPLKIFTDLSFMPAKGMPITMLDPLWPGRSLENKRVDNLQAGRLGEYNAIFPEIFEVVCIEQADVAVFPAAWELSRNFEGIKKLTELRELTRRHQKKLIVFVGGDLQPNLPFNDIIVFHTSLIGLLRKNDQYGFPAFIEDLAAQNFGNCKRFRNWEQRPTLSFCGTAYPLQMPLGSQKLKEIFRFIAYSLGVLKWRPQLVGYAPRAKAILAVRESAKINVNIVIRPSSPVRWAYGYLLSKAVKDDITSLRNEYFESILKSDYVLCVRGMGNYSIRLYETLCLGRIPVIVNTGLVLPFEEHLPWKSFCVWVEENEIHTIEEKILAFHHKHSGEAFLRLQKLCRHTWKDWLSPEGFFNNFYLHFSA
jgi:hypothetical protein